MNKLISISGSQGCGKSTTIRLLHERHGYSTDSISIPRYVQKTLGYTTLAEVLQQPISKIKDYQMAILEAKRERDLKNKATDEAGGIMIVERNFADIYAFATQWAIDSGNAEFQQWVEGEYKQLCIKYHEEIDYLSVLLFPLSSFEVDPRRASAESRQAVHDRMWEFIAARSPFGNQVGNWTALGFENLDQRVFEVHRTIQQRVFPDGEINRAWMAAAFASMFEANKKRAAE